MPALSYDQNQLCQLAAEARKNAYAPYSQYQVGAALLMESGTIYTGCNVENASYGLAMCAERVAVGKAVSQGDQKILAVAVATKDGGSPCGACRQVLAEFAQGDLEVLLVNAQGEPLLQLTLDELLPKRFSLDSDD